MLLRELFESSTCFLVVVEKFEPTIRNTLLLYIEMTHCDNYFKHCRVHDVFFSMEEKNMHMRERRHNISHKVP